MDICPEWMHSQDKIRDEALAGLALETVDNCPERMNAVDAEAPRPPRIETAVEFCPRVAVEETVEEAAVDICPERMEYSDFVLQTDSADSQQR